MRRQPGMVEAAVGYAPDGRGRGVALVRLMVSGGQLLRMSFPAPSERCECDYAAVTAILSRLLSRGLRRVRLLLPSAQIVEEVAGRAKVSERCVLAHLRLRCMINQFDRCELVGAPGGEVDDLVQRARAEAALHCAA